MVKLARAMLVSSALLYFVAGFSSLYTPGRQGWAPASVACVSAQSVSQGCPLLALLVKMVGTCEFWKIRPYKLQPKEKILKENELRSKVLKKFEIEKIFET